MNPEDLKVGMHVWAWWRGELLLYTGKRTKDYSYQFENFGDQLVWIPEHLISELEYRADR